MGRITRAAAFGNNEIAYIAWELDGMIAGCLGFDILRIMIDGSEPPKGLPTWVPFEGQRNPDWTPQDTGVWPVQRLYWRDLTLRRHRADLGRRPAGFDVRYSIRPVGDMVAGLEPVPVRQPVAYEGPPRPLGYLGPAVETGPVRIDLEFAGAQATFNNGMLSGQWLRQAIESDGKPFTPDAVLAEIRDRDSPVRAYLAGDIIDSLLLFLRDPRFADGMVRLALYELADAELVEALIAAKARIEVILSNSGKPRGGTEWDKGNADARAALKAAGVVVHDRMFNNGHIGHNKFAVSFDAAGAPRAVLTGSTNWTSTGLCGQSNNAAVSVSAEAAAAYAAYWERLRDDAFPAPVPPDAPGRAAQVQGAEIRGLNGTAVNAAFAPGAPARLWFAPNTKATTKRPVAPPDLAELFGLITAAKQAVMLLCFLPSRAGKDSVISAALDAGALKPEIFVIGAISDVTAMPGYVAPNAGTGDEGKRPFTFDRGGVHLVRAAALDESIGDFEREILRVGNAIVHDKIVVIDPLSENCVVATGSHNMGFKASYENDENLVLVRRNRPLALAYAAHVLDVYDHYRFRAWQQKARAEGRPPLFDGAIDGDDGWLSRALARPKDISRYFLGAADGGAG